jgi:hypothetical protein
MTMAETGAEPGAEPGPGQTSNLLKSAPQELGHLSPPVCLCLHIGSK